MADIVVTRRSETSFEVTVVEGRTSTKHIVVVEGRDLDRYAPGRSPEDLVRASFEFLLDREPKEAILARFDLPVIERYFPEYPLEVGALLR